MATVVLAIDEDLRVAVTVERDGDHWLAIHEETHAFGTGTTKTDALEACAAYLRSDRDWYCRTQTPLTGALLRKKRTYARLFGCDAGVNEGML